MRTYSLSIVVMLVLFGLLQSATAATVAVLPIESKKYPEVAQKLTRYIKEAIQRTPALSEKKGTTLSLEDARMSFACITEEVDCMLQVAEALSVTVLFWGHLSKVNGVWELYIRELSVEAADLTQMRTLTLPAKYAREDTFKRMAVSVIDGGDFDPRPTSILSLGSDPIGARVSIDGESVGDTPLALEVAHGEHLVQFTHPDYPTARRSILVTDRPAKLVVTLENRPAPAPLAPRVDNGGTSFRFWGGIIGSSVLAVAGVVVGILAHNAADRIAADRQKILDQRQDELAIFRTRNPTMTNLPPERAALYQDHIDEQDDNYTTNVYLKRGTLVAAGVSAAIASYLFLTTDKKKSIAVGPGSATLVIEF